MGSAGRDRIVLFRLDHADLDAVDPEPGAVRDRKIGQGGVDRGREKFDGIKSAFQRFVDQTDPRFKLFHCVPLSFSP